MAGKPTAPAAAVPTAATPLATPAAKPNANDDKSRANRLTGAGVESASPRLLFASQVLIGHSVEAQVRDGTVYEGIFHSINVSKEGGLSATLKMAMMKKGAEGKALDMKAIAVKPEAVLMIEGKDLVQLFAKGVRTDAAYVGPDQDDMGFGTDSAISRDRGGAGLAGRELQKWVPDAEGMALEDLSLGRGGMGDNSGGGGWDQFATNQSMYGVKSTYDENLYTTKLDKVSSKISEQEAERIAREIERGLPGSNNRHVAEERGLVDDSGEMDEEDKYSSVIRDDGKPKKPQRPAWSIAGAGVDVIKGALGMKTDGEGSTTETEAKTETEQTPVEQKEQPAPVQEAPKEEKKPEKEEVEGSEKKETAESSVAEKKAVKSTLNPNAKAFTFNPNAKEFVPSFGGSSSARAASSTSATSSTSSAGGAGHGHKGGGGGGYSGGNRGGGNWNHGGGGHHGGGGQMHMHGGPNTGGWAQHMSVPGSWGGGGAGFVGGMMNMGGAANSQGMMGYGGQPRGFQMPGPFYSQGAVYAGGYGGHPNMHMMVPGGNLGGGGGGRPHGGGGGHQSGDSA